MKRTEERIAEKLMKDLKRFFKDKDETVKISIEGAGVHWSCILVLNERICEINCFEHRHYSDIKPEYLISFEEKEKNKAWGRTFDSREIIQASSDWMNNKGIDFLHGKFEFVDWYKRRIQKIERELIRCEPELGQTQRDLNSPFDSGLYDYQIDFNSRSCKLSGFGKEEPISFAFYWDECKLFELKQNDLNLFAPVIKKWLIDEMAPSVLEQQYKWVQTGVLAKYYQKGEGIKGEFMESWRFIEDFYKKSSDEHHSFKTDALKLIREMKAERLDQVLRAGQSLFFFIVSRSRRHGLEKHHSYLHITFLGENRMKIKSRLADQSVTKEVPVQYKGYLEEQVHELLKEKVEEV